MSQSDNIISQPNSLPNMQLNNSQTKSLEKVSVQVPNENVHIKNVTSVLNRISKDVLNESDKVSIILKDNTVARKENQNQKIKLKEEKINEQKPKKDNVKYQKTNKDKSLDEKPKQNKIKAKKENIDQVVSLIKDNGHVKNKGLFDLSILF